MDNYQDGEDSGNPINRLDNIVNWHSEIITEGNANGLFFGAGSQNRFPDSYECSTFLDSDFEIDACTHRKLRPIYLLELIGQSRLDGSD